MKGRELKAIREQLELTQAEFARELGVTPNSVARWERGEMNIRGPVERLARLLLELKRKKQR